MIATAPGKLLLTGEYAVLEGAPALVVAVNRRVIARKRTSATGSSPFLIAVADELARRYGSDHPVTRAAFDIVVDSSAFFLGQAKLGLGSSAAVTVAATALALSAERHTVPMIDRDNVLAIATAAHQHAQRSRRRARDSGSHMIVAPRVRATTEELAIATTSRDSSTSIVAAPSSADFAPLLIGGSGADIAAAVHGGVIAFAAQGSAPPQITRLPWPAKLRLIPFFTGESADSAELIARVMQARASRRTDVETALTAIAKASRAACQGAESRMPEIGANAFLSALQQAAIASDALASATGIPLVPPCVTKAHRALAKLGGMAKTTGAGGGDVGVAVLPASENVIIAERFLIEAGCQPLCAEVDITGVDLQPDAQ